MMEFMESDLTCCVCLEIFVTPLMLPCTHNLCKRCVVGLTSDSSITKFNCPKCRLEIQVGSRTGINSLPRNLALDNLACLFRDKAKITAEKTCNTHERSLDFYCKTCKCLVCSECSTSKHNDFPHNVSSMKHLIAEEKNNVQDLTDQMDDIEVELSKNIRTVQRYIKDIKTSEEANCQTIEQNLGNLVSAINTLKQVFVKKLRQDSQQQIEHLSTLEHDYRRLQRDICALRSQIRYQDSPDLVQKYTAYQNIKMRVSSFLAFKVFKMTGPPHSQPEQPIWKLENAEHVYHAIQTLGIHKEPMDFKSDKTSGGSQSLPASPKCKPSLFKEKSLDYGSDNETLWGTRGGDFRSFNSVSKLMKSQDTIQTGFGGRSFLNSPASAPVLSGSEFSSFSSILMKKDRPNNGVAETQRHLISDRNFNEFMTEFKINSDSFLSSPNQNEKNSKVKQTSGSELMIQSSAGRQQPNTPTLSGSSGLTMSPSGGARPKEPQPKNVSNICTSRVSEVEYGSNSSGVQQTADCQTNSSLDGSTNQCTSPNMFGDKTFSFTVGSSDKKQSARGKGQKKRTHSLGRLNPNKHHQ